MSDGPQKLPPKKDVALALLEGPSMYVHMDPRRPGVLVPKRFLDKAQLVLQIGLNMFIPIHDLTVDDDGITCTLSFDRAPFWCRMPWSAIYALVGEDGRGMMWPSDIPPEVVAQMQAPPQKDGKEREASAGKPQGKRPRGKLSAVGEPPPEREAPPEEPNEAKEAAPEPEAKGPRLAAVPDPAEPAPSEPEPSDAAPSEAAASSEATSGEAVKESPAQEPARPAPAAGPGRKPKRELPPYLRVIK